MTGEWVLSWSVCGCASQLQPRGDHLSSAVVQSNHHLAGGLQLLLRPACCEVAGYCPLNLPLAKQVLPAPKLGPGIFELLLQSV